MSQLIQEEQLISEIQSIRSHLSHRARTLVLRQEARAGPPEECSTEYLLLQWCRVILAKYDIAVNNLTTSFADGRVLCYLIHHYHPQVLPRADIYPQTSKLLLDLDAIVMEEWTTKPLDTQDKLDEQLRGECRNFDILQQKVHDIGAIPPHMIPRTTNRKNVPEEKSLVLFLSYLQSRLIESNLEIRKARVIQRWYKSRKHQVLDKAARVIQRQWTRNTYWSRLTSRCRAFIQQAKAEAVAKARAQEQQLRRDREIHWAVCTIQRAYEHYREVKWQKYLFALQEEQREEDAAMKIQRAFHQYQNYQYSCWIQQQEQEQREEDAAKTIQRAFRQYQEVQFQRLVRQQIEEQAAKTIQRAFQQYQQYQYSCWIQKQEQEQREEDAAKTIQRAFRQHQEVQFQRLVRQQIEEQAAKTIQRAFHQYQNYQYSCWIQQQQEHHAAMVIQKAFHQYQEVQVARFKLERRQTAAATIIQLAFFRHLEYQLMLSVQLEKETQAAVVIQKAFHHYQEYQLMLSVQHQRKHEAAVVIQLAFHHYQERRKQKHEAACRIQLAFFRHQEYQLMLIAQLEKETQAAVVIQKAFHHYQEYQLMLSVQHQRKHEAAVVIQKAFFRHLEYQLMRMVQLEKETQAAVVIQAAVHHYQDYQRAKARTKAAQSIQHWTRALMEKQNIKTAFQLECRAQLVLQRLLQRWLRRRTVAITRLQSWWKTSRAKSNFQHTRVLILSCQRIQSWWRGTSVRKARFCGHEWKSRLCRLARARHCPTLGAQCHMALAVLLPERRSSSFSSSNESNFGQLITAAEVLLTCTSYSYECCHLCLESIWPLLGTCQLSNRSDLARQYVSCVVESCWNVRRFVKYKFIENQHETLVRIFQSEFILRLYLDMLQKYRRDMTIFCRVVALLTEEIRVTSKRHCIHSDFREVLRLRLRQLEDNLEHFGTFQSLVGKTKEKRLWNEKCAMKRIHRLQHLLRD